MTVMWIRIHSNMAPHQPPGGSESGPRGVKNGLKGKKAGKILNFVFQSE